MYCQLVKMRSLAFIIAFSCFLVSWIPQGHAENATMTGVSVNATQLKQMVEGSHHVIVWFSNLTNIVRVEAHVQDEAIIGIASKSLVMEGRGNNSALFYGHVNVSALFIGYSHIYLDFYDESDKLITTETVTTPSVVLSYQKMNDIFTLLMSIFVSLAYVNMGATLDLSVVKRILKKPIGPILGVICQYIFMPLIAFALGKIVFPGNSKAQLGMFLSGCSPGGGLSNMWTFLLGGSLDLSMMMTFVSNIIAFGSVPLWVFMMGPSIIQDADFVIPYKDITVLVMSLSIPCVIGLLIQRFLPRVAKFLKMTLTPLSVFNILFIFTFGVYANRYIFHYFTPLTLLAGFLSPFLGYVSGLLLAKICCQPTKDVIAISIETGMQNNTVALIILKLTFEKPAGDITSVFPCAAVIMTPIPLLVALLIKRIYECQTKSKSQDITQEKPKVPLENGGFVGDSEKQMELQTANSVKNSEKQMNGDVVPSSNNTEPKTQSVEGGGENSDVGGGVDNPAADLKDDNAV